MIRPALIEVALFLAPFAAFAAYLWFTKTPVFDREHWTIRVLSTLAITALALTASAFVLLVHFSGAPVGSNYVPAHVEDGKFVPGRLVP
jgi:Family of unknown function (DUF6111)